MARNFGSEETEITADPHEEVATIDTEVNSLQSQVNNNMFWNIDIKIQLFYCLDSTDNTDGNATFVFMCWCVYLHLYQETVARNILTEETEKDVNPDEEVYFYF